MYPHNGKIAYDHPGEIPDYIKAKVKVLFAKGYRK
jgi:hypothetical protein